MIKFKDILTEIGDNIQIAPGSTFTINENGNLLVIGKLAQAVEMRDDVDINFVIKWSI